jgi:hypothetical protein
VRTCLDKCFDAPVCELRTPAGTATLLRARPDEVVAAITDALATI